MYSPRTTLGPRRGQCKYGSCKGVSTLFNLESLNEAIQRLAMQQKEILEWARAEKIDKNQSLQGPRCTPLKDSHGRYICYTCNKPGHINRGCPLNKNLE